MVIVAVYSVLEARLARGLNWAVLLVTATVPAIAPPPEVSVKLAVVSVEFFIASEKLADIVELSGMPVALFAGDVRVTVGRVVSGVAAVVKFQVKFDVSGLPAASLAVVVMVAVYWVLPKRLADGTKVAVVPLTFTVPPTAPPPVTRTKKLAVFTVEFVIASENTADTEAFKATSVAPLAGDLANTVGGVVSGAAAVMKCHV